MRQEANKFWRLISEKAEVRIQDTEVRIQNPELRLAPAERRTVNRLPRGRERRRGRARLMPLAVLGTVNCQRRTDRFEAKHD